MSAIAINTKYVQIPGLENQDFLEKGKNGQLKISSLEPTLPISLGNNLVFIKPINDDLVFTNSATVTRIDPRLVVKSDSTSASRTNKTKKRDSYDHYFSFEVEEILKENNKLSELEYSLPIISNYLKPEVHFQTQYRTLEKDDYQTIVKGWIYATRTVFGKLANALPRQNKLEFMIESIDNFSTINFKEISLVDGLDFLYKYIDRRILSRGELLIGIDRILNRHLGDLLPVEEVGLIDPQSNKAQNINSQAKIFNDLFQLEKGKNLKDSLRETIDKNSQLEERFQKMFSRKTWPIDLER
ncbi:hypothetical protein [Sphingobacterium tabacisoli]|uniref:Uncharacterized protein n=1 Tax=Sphingobacterium tabacisoli TaxID=2044855 RepID=A0ABW5L877_9SPHI|nr:hypothetical protein [Sphingobacterium tabacisoli]